MRLGGIRSRRGLQLCKSGKGVTALGSLAGDIDGHVSSGLVPGTPRALKMSSKAVRH